MIQKVKSQDYRTSVYYVHGLMVANLCIIYYVRCQRGGILIMYKFILHFTITINSRN